MKKSDTVIILPAYNEEKYISSVLTLLNKSGWRYVAIDDGSDDNTYKIMQKLAKHSLRHKINLGKGAALRTGCQFAFNQLGAKAVVFMDSDGQHDVTELDAFFNKFKKGYSLILGIRSFDNSMPLIKIMSNRFASVLIMLLFGRYIPDVPSGYKAMTQNIYKKLRLKSSDYSIELEIAVKIAKFNLKYATIPIKTIYHDLDKGFQFLDAMQMILNLISWRVQLI